MFALVGLVVAFALVVGGVALVSVPGALVTAGVLCGGVSLLFVDFDRKAKR